MQSLVIAVRPWKHHSTLQRLRIMKRTCQRGQTFAQSGKGILVKAAELLDLPGIPNFSVKWNALGGIFNRPTVLPTLAGWQGFGDDGAEAITPIETLKAYVRESVRSENEPVLYYMQKLLSILAEYLPQIAEKDQSIILDGKLI